MAAANPCLDTNPKYSCAERKDTNQVIGPEGFNVSNRGKDEFGNTHYVCEWPRLPYYCYYVYSCEDKPINVTFYYLDHLKYRDGTTELKLRGVKCICMLKTDDKTKTTKYHWHIEDKVDKVDKDVFVEEKPTMLGALKALNICMGLYYGSHPTLKLYSELSNSHMEIKDPNDSAKCEDINAVYKKFGINPTDRYKIPTGGSHLTRVNLCYYVYTYNKEQITVDFYFLDLYKILRTWKCMYKNMQWSIDNQIVSDEEKPTILGALHALNSYRMKSEFSHLPKLELYTSNKSEAFNHQKLGDQQKYLKYKQKYLQLKKLLQNNF